MSPTYLEITQQDIPDEIFKISSMKGTILLKYGKAQPIVMPSPLVLDESLAKLPALLLDGSLTKNLQGVMFSQKKDLSKAEEFSFLLRDIFDVIPRHRMEQGTSIVSCGNRSLCYFLHTVLDINKSDEHTKIPKWIWRSPLDVKKAYLQYAFDMEGSVKDPSLGEAEIKFHSCDYYHTIELQDFIKKSLDIYFKVQEYYVKDYGWKYYLYIHRSQDIKKFAQHIGFTLDSHQNRLKQSLKLFKPRAWEIALSIVLKYGKDTFSSREIHQLSPYLTCRRSTHSRLSRLVYLGYLVYDKSKKTYVLTKKSLNLKRGSFAKTDVRLRTNPHENERLVFDFINKNSECWINQISRSLGIHRRTVMDVVKRLEGQGRIRIVNSDKFQRKIIRGT